MASAGLSERLRVPSSVRGAPCATTYGPAAFAIGVMSRTVTWNNCSAVAPRLSVTMSLPVKTPLAVVGKAAVGEGGAAPGARPSLSRSITPSFVKSHWKRAMRSICSGARVSLASTCRAVPSSTM